MLVAHGVGAEADNLGALNAEAVGRNQEDAFNNAHKTPNRCERGRGT